jgi:hypothetical protein
MVKTTLSGLGLLAACLFIGTSSSSAYLKVAAAGDISCPSDSTARHAIKPGDPLPKAAAGKCQGHRVAKLIKAGRPDIVFALGDLIQGQTSYKGAYRDFGLAWGFLGKKIVSTVGNHDYHRNRNGDFTASGYFRYWKSKNAPAWRVGKYREGWTSWNHGRWHMVNLNSNCFAIDCAFTGRQLEWLARDLEANEANPKTQCTLAYFHHPLFSAGVYRGRAGKESPLANIWELLYRYRTDLVLNGHQHHYERFRPQNPGGKRDRTGITEIISGTGGASTFRIEDEHGRIAANSVASFRGLGTTFLKLGANTYSSSFRGLDGKFRDKQKKKKCLKPNAGSKRRAPRIERYNQHMAAMASLDRRIDRLVKKIKRLKKSRYVAPYRYARARQKKDQLAARRDRVRERRLYY